VGKERFDDCYRRYFKSIRGYIRQRVRDRERADELAQDTFLKAFRAWDQYDPNRGQLSTWLWTIARNTVIDYARDREVEVEDFDVDELCPAWEEPEIRLKGERAELSRRIASLTELQREIVELLMAENLSYRQIAERKKLSLSAVKGLIHRARAALKERT